MDRKRRIVRKRDTRPAIASRVATGFKYLIPELESDSEGAVGGVIADSGPESESIIVRRALQLIESVCEPVCVRMSYGDSWNAKMRRVMSMKWVSLNDFSRWVKEFQYASFFVKANRDRVREAYLSLNGEAPARSDKRFPSDIFVVMLSQASLRIWVDQALHAIDLPDRMMERNSGNVDYAGMNDAKRSYDVAMDKLSRLCDLLDENELCESGIFCRETFESHFQLVWM